MISNRTARRRPGLDKPDASRFSGDPPLIVIVACGSFGLPARRVGLREIAQEVELILDKLDLHGEFLQLVAQFAPEPRRPSNKTLFSSRGWHAIRTSNPPGHRTGGTTHGQ